MYRLAHVISDVNVGGAGRYLWNLLKYSNTELFNIDIICPHNGELFKLFSNLDFNLLELPDGDNTLSLKQFRVLNCYFSKNKYHIVHTHANLSGRLAAVLNKVPVKVYTRHGIGKNRTKMGKLQNRLISLFTDRAVAVSNAVKDSLVRDGFPSNKITVIYNGIDFEEIHNAGFKNIKKELGFDENIFVIGVVARLTPEKGHEILLKALQKLKQRDKQFKVLFIGDGVYKNNLENQIKNLGMENDVYILGYRKDVISIIKNLDISVLPSLSEGLGLALLESMACGVPVIGTKTGGIPEIIKHMHNGLLVKSGDEHGLADAIEMLMIDRNLRLKLAEKGRETVEKSFNALKMAEETEKMYLQLLNDKKVSLGSVR
ncbi:MAG: hypothetical protein PWQ82_999 [Thermosediminibacterales bacterium]|nr:hypothetical protein [Thermosediminibacterales bacterium]